MKKTTKFFTVMLAAMLVMPMVACEPEADPTTPAPTTEVTEVQPTEEPVVEPEVTEEPAPTEEVVEPEVTEEVVEDNPNVIDGIDFTEFNEGDASFFDIMENYPNNDNLKLIALSDKRVEAILEDGDSIIQEKDNGEYTFFFYTSKDVKSVYKIGGKDVSADIAEYPNIRGYCFVKDEVTGTDIECGATVTYEDGTEESITIYVTKDYVIE